MDYLDFDIELCEHDDSHYAIAVRSPVAEARSTTPFPLTAAALKADLHAVTDCGLTLSRFQRKGRSQVRLSWSAPFAVRLGARTESAKDGSRNVKGVADPFDIVIVKADKFALQGKRPHLGGDVV